MTERAHQTAMTGLNAGIQLTQIKSNLQADVWKLYYSMQGLILDKYKTDVQAEITRVEAEIKKILADYDLIKAGVQAETGLKLDLFKTLAQGEETRVKNETALEIAKSEVILKSNDNLLQTALANAKIELESWTQHINQLTERGKIDIQQLTTNNQLRVEAAKSQAEYYKGVISSIAQMVSTIQLKEE